MAYREPPPALKLPPRAPWWRLLWHWRTLLALWARDERRRQGAAQVPVGSRKLARTLVNPSPLSGGSGKYSAEYSGPRPAGPGRRGRVPSMLLPPHGILLPAVGSSTATTVVLSMAAVLPPRQG